MITSGGKKFFKRYMAGQGGTIVGGIAVGIGGSAPTALDTKMQFEFSRVPIVVTDYDFTNDKLIYKATLPPEVSGKIYEIGMWTSMVNSTPGSQESKILTYFDSEDEEWDVETYSTEDPRIGIDSLKHTPAAGATSASVLMNITLDLGEYSSDDLFTIAFNPQNANTASVKFRLRTDSSNYFEYTISNPTAGYKIVDIRKGLGVVVGTPNWSDINEIEIITTAKPAGLASVLYDGLRIEDYDSLAPEYGLIARSAFTTPIIKKEGVALDIEYALSVTV